MDWQMVWLGVLTVALAAHMVKDTFEFRKIKKLEADLSELRAKK